MQIHLISHLEVSWYKRKRKDVSRVPVLRRFKLVSFNKTFCMHIDFNILLVFQMSPRKSTKGKVPKVVSPWGYDVNFA